MYVCSQCEAKYPMKLGKCTNCGKFGTIIKDPTMESKKGVKSIMGDAIKRKEKIIDLGHIELSDPEISRVFGGKGIKKGGIYLLGGEPGIGKSTIMLQIIDGIKGEKVGYFSGEENEDQIYDRAKRLKIKDFEIYNAYALEDIFATISEQKYSFVIIDSIQTVYSKNLEGVGGSITQIRYCSERITEFFKSRGITCFIIGHITKDGDIGGPKYLEHIVDGVMYLEGDRWGVYRFLRAKKNRFGPSDEIGIFEMLESGLKGVNDYRERIMKDYDGQAGNALSIGVNNGRPLLISIEVLISQSKGKFPQRNTIGYDKDRLLLILAILNKHLGLSDIEEKDVFINIPGEMKFKDNGIDLGVAAAIISCLYNKKVLSKNIFIGELTLMGKVKNTSFHSKRLKEGRDFTCVDNTMVSQIKDLSNYIRNS